MKQVEPVGRKESSTRTEKINSEKTSSPVEKTVEKEDEKGFRNRKERENDLENAINEEVQWAYEQKRMMKEELDKTNGMSEEIKEVEKKKMEDNAKREKTEKDLVNVLAKKAEEKLAVEKEEMRKARQKEESERSEKERKRKEKELEIAISEEILWANEQKKLSNDTKMSEVAPSINTLQEKSEEKVTPPAPARRRRTGAGEEQDLPVIPNRRSRVAEREGSSPVSVCEGRRSLGVGVETRPGYSHASTQTDPVRTCDFGV